MKRTPARLFLAVSTVLTGCATTPRSTDGEAPLAFMTKRDGNTEIYLLPSPGARPVNLTQHPATDHGFSWSPDGERIAFGTDRDGHRQIYVMNADGSDPVNLSRHPAEDGQPAWSPDGRHIAFVSKRDHAKGEVYVMTAEGTDVRRLTFNEDYEEVPAWSPDGRTLAYCRYLPEPGETNSGNGELFLLGLDGEAPRRLTYKEGFDSAPSWSPDGERIAFHGTDEDGADLFVIGIDGTGLVNLTDDAPEDWQPAWSADGSRIYYCSGHGPHAYDIWVMEADGTGRRKLTHYEGRDECPRPRPR